MQPARNTIWTIQILRGVAALLVVFHHLRGPAPWLFNPIGSWEFGTGGVDIFFIISGFVMFTVARDEPLPEFIRRRIIRVVPLYWIATLLFLLLAFAALESEVAGIGVQHIVKSLFFIPFFNPAHHGAAWPLLVPGWTLNYEMFFYAIFGLSLLSRRLLPVLTALIVLAVVGGLLLDYPSAVWKVYTSPLLLEFLAGVWLGHAYLHHDVSKLKPLLIAGIAGLFANSFGIFGTWQAAMTGVFSLAIVAGALAFESSFDKKPHWLPVLLGQASYSIYLSHIITLAFVFTIWKRLPLTGYVQFAGLIVLGLAACIAVGILVHFVVEKPVTRWLSDLSRRIPTTG